MSPKKKYYETIAKTLIKNFEKRGMEGYYCEDSKQAVEKVLSMMPAGSTVSWGGSVTLKETSIMEALHSSDYELIDRASAKTPEEKRKLYGKIVCSDYYLTSSNAISLDGQLINIDGNGNRVACLITGPENVIVVAGMNKLVNDVTTGIERVRNFAAPPNAVRLNYKTSCAVTGKCEDCYTPDCMCCEIVITRKSRTPNRIKVILIGEELGY